MEKLPAHKPASKTTYYTLFMRFSLVALVLSLVPLAFIASYIHHSYSRFSEFRMKDSFQRRVNSSRNLVELFLQERLFNLQLLFETHKAEFFADASNLKTVFRTLNHNGQYEDLGLINGEGFHVSYAGPYDLFRNDYSVTFWFKGVMEKGTFVSDMFLGYRDVPHFIIAVLKKEDGVNWILRATIATEALSSLLEGITIGKTGEVFLLNPEGVYQTAPKQGGKIMERSDLPINVFIRESGIERISTKNGPKIVAYSWLKNPPWLLVVQQEYSEFFEDVSFADYATTVFLIVSALAVLFVISGSTAYIVNFIRNRDRELETMNKQLVQSGKLASIGKLAAGVAHEINNPLAVIQSEIDLARELAPSEVNSAQKSLIQIEIQVERCSKIVRNLLSFSRRIKAEVGPVDLNESVIEAAGLFSKWASSVGIELSTELQEHMPKILSDPFEIGQVLINLIGNAIDSHEGKGGGFVRISTFTDALAACIAVEDGGCGIPREYREQIFDPFFTTKPAGKGTGLGLSITYSIIRELNGDIQVESSLGKGSRFLVCFPLDANRKVSNARKENSADR